MNIKNMRERFEVNMLDGDSVDDCGGCMLNAKEVLEYFKEDLEQELKKEREEIVETIEIRIEETKIKKRETPFVDTLLNYEVNVLKDIINTIKNRA